MYYKLVDRRVVPATREEWHVVLKGECHVGCDEVGPYCVSTVFLGRDHRFVDEGEPLVFETMVFEGSRSKIDMERYSTYGAAEAGHAAMVAKFRGIVENGALHQAMRQVPRN